MNQEVNISVICPVYNSSQYIEKTLNCVYCQDITPYELIIIDDGSTDNTVNIIKNIFSEYRGDIICTLIENAHLGPGSSRNAGIRRAKGNWIAFLDSDDIWYTNKIKYIKNVITFNPNYNFICHNEFRVNEKGKKIINYGKRYSGEIDLQKQIYTANMFSTSAVTCKKNLLDQHGYFDESMMSAQDYELWLRISPYIHVNFVSEVLGEYIERKGNITSGSLIKRYRNEFKIALSYRRQFNVSTFAVRMVRLNLSYFIQLIKRLKRDA